MISHAHEKKKGSYTEFVAHLFKNTLKNIFAFLQHFVQICYVCGYLSLKDEHFCLHYNFT